MCSQSVCTLKVTPPKCCLLICTPVSYFLLFDIFQVWLSKQWMKKRTHWRVFFIGLVCDFKIPSRWPFLNSNRLCVCPCYRPKVLVPSRVQPVKQFCFLGFAAVVGTIPLFGASPATRTAGLWALPLPHICVRHPVRMHSQEHHLSGDSSYFSWLTSSSPPSWQPLRAHLFCWFFEGYCLLLWRREGSSCFSAMPQLPFRIFSGMRGKDCGWKLLKPFLQSLFSCNVVILYGHKLWLTHSKDISLKTFRILICSKEAFTLFEAQIHWENRFSGAYSV